MSGLMDIGTGQGDDMFGYREYGGDPRLRVLTGATRTMITTPTVGHTMRVTGTTKIMATTTIGDIGRPWFPGPAAQVGPVATHLTL
jgi:hypothetical protein